MKARKTMRRHWYRLYYGECPVCGDDKSYRERVYGRKPGNHATRYMRLSDAETYDNCLG